MRLLTPVSLDIRAVLFEPDEMILSVEFPLKCVVSLVTPLDGGAVVEVATVGREGIVGVPLVRRSGRKQLSVVSTPTAAGNDAVPRVAG